MKLSKKRMLVPIVFMILFIFAPTLVRAQSNDLPEDDGRIINETNIITPKTPDEFEEQGDVLGATTLAETGDSTILSTSLGLLILVSALILTKKSKYSYQNLL
jgi:LPXTG-motif cell wall-anchored protein